MSTVDAGLLLLRVVLAALLAGHGLQKALGWFHGPGIDAAAALFDAWGFRPGRWMVVVAAGCELVAAALFLLGLATPLAGAITVGTMAVAAAPNVANGLWAVRGGYELPLVYAVLGGGLALAGAGAFSLDQVLDLPTAGWVGALAVALGLLASAVPLSRRRAALRTPAPST